MNINAIVRLESLLDQLAIDAHKTDEGNKLRKSHYYLHDKPLFDNKLFPIESANFFAYVKYTQKRLQHLKLLIDKKQFDFTDALFAELESQILSLITAIKSNESRYHDSDYRLDRRHRLSAKKNNKKYQAVAKHLLMPSHQLHEKMAETRGFERRLMQMIDDKQALLNSSKLKDTSNLQMEVLTLHQRLGRCRKAISDIEKQIEFSEKKR